MKLFVLSKLRACGRGGIVKKTDIFKLLKFVLSTKMLGINTEIE
jgi:hypothetical protein